MSHDFRKPYTKAELDELREIFKKMANPDGNVNSSQIPDLIDAIGYSRTPVQKAAYVHFWETSQGTTVTIDDFIDVASSLHSTAQFSRENATRFDKDKDGFISAGEFNELLKMLEVHDPRLERKTYEDFVQEADTDLDGKVSIKECTDWIHSYCESRCTTPVPF